MSTIQSSNSVLNDVQEVNLSYLLLAQRLLREDYSVGLYRLGLEDDVAQIIMSLSPAQLMKLANCGALVCKFRLNDFQLLSSLTQDVLGGSLQRAHATILMAQQPVGQEG